MHKLLINGEWVEALSAQGRGIENPATLAALGVVADCGPADVARAAGAARAALDSWRNLAVQRRAQCLREIAADLGARASAIAALLTQESGKPLPESLDCVAGAAAIFEHYGATQRWHAEPPLRPEAPPLRPRGATTSPAAPAGEVGVLAAVVAFDFPLLRMALAMAPAIARGCTVLCLPPPRNPLANLSCARAMERLPAGVFNMITGGADTTAALDADRGIDYVSRGEPASCDSMIVCSDADLDVAVPGVAWARLHNGGQSCASSTRIYVERPLAAAFADALHRYVAFLEVGDPRKRDTDLGPLISREALVRVGDQVAYAVKDGARLKLGGLRFRPWGLPGHFFQPTILTDVRPGSLAACEDFLGPVLPIIPVADAAEAIAIARDARRGGRTAIYTRDPRAVRRANESFGIEGDCPPGRLEHVTERRPSWFPYRDRSQVE